MTTLVVDTNHSSMIHDAQMDYYGKRLATASSDRTVRVFDVSNDEHTLVANLRGHDGAVWQVAWSHPKFGGLLATCGFDRRVIVWKEQSAGAWVKVYEYAKFSASVNSVAWGAEPLGLVLAAASSDGTVAVISFQEASRSWAVAHFNAHPGGVNSVSWAPAALKASVLGAGGGPEDAAAAARRFVTGGCDSSIKVWTYSAAEAQWTARAGAFEGGHQDWVRDVAWAPSLGLPTSTVASCGEDQKVIVWEERDGAWKKQQELPFEHKVWRVSWSVMGNILAVSQGDNKVSLWKETLDGKWSNLTALEEEDAREL